MEQKQLRQLENKCVQGHPPACTAACPIHVNVREFIEQLQQNNFTAAREILQKSMPFPGILGRICDHPCQDACKRQEAGGAIAIAELERACVQLSFDPAAKINVLPAKNRSVAVVGAGLSGLTVAYELAKKGYNVAVFEKSDCLGGSLRKLDADKLPPQVIEMETSQLSKMGVQIFLQTRVGRDVTLDELCQKYEAVYLGLGLNPEDTFQLQLNGSGLVDTHPVTCLTSRDNVFAGGSMCAEDGRWSPIGSVFDGKRAANSIDRCLQQVSLTAMREKEGPYQTELYSSTKGVVPLPVVPMADSVSGYSREEAVREAGRCLQCQCLECVKACTYMKSFGRYPKQYLREIYNNEAIVMGIHHANKLINSCSLCGQCEVVCPTNLNLGEVCLEARRSMVRRGKMPPSAHDFAIRDMLFSNSDKFALARHKPGTEASTDVFFPGCQLSASAPGQVERVYQWLQENHAGSVGMMLRCCGAPAHWAGREELFQDGMKEFLSQWREMGQPRLILACSTCYQIIKSNLPEIEVISLWELFDQSDLPATAVKRPDITVSVHDPCTTRQERQIQNSVRNILGKLGCTIEELPYSGEKTSCCGFGGLESFANPGLAREVVKERIAAGPADYITYCAMCRDNFAAQDKRTLHLLDLIFGEDWEVRANRKGPGFSQRHENRVRLKNKLLREVWKETVPQKNGYEAVKLKIPPAVENIMEERLILAEDIRQVIHFAEESGQKMVDPQTGRFLAYYKPASVTYWVEYAPQGDEYVVFNAYSHRMEIVGEVKR
ncbi:pyridine nucleotide-disulfide oxidoreductase/dicluster-binding protein [Desulfolucanica intricata]|uniref:pyridine nucleotide-disulfide oxidoreductase/dicluster-binding protein n=1 Tax=Desulfolucanica intricata TaxID=1285191 RepID=UPI00082B3B12|nr:pyridine nucleotide-disulfide oxidoreductase/dicluster-binding protein [Desulfolucanica intricata]